jgi:hypothetical protein
MFIKPEMHQEVVERGHVAVIASLMATLPADVDPPILGSAVSMWKQDPTVTEIGVRTSYIPSRIGVGPRDDQIVLSGVPQVYPDRNGDFLPEPANQPAFDTVHTFAVVRETLTMYQRLLGEKLDWQWNTGGNRQPITVFPHAGLTANAYYSRDEKCLKFFFFDPPGVPVASESRVFTCRSLDIVAHETGHGVLDSLKPGWWAPHLPQTGGLHESFGDLSAIFLMLSQLDLVEFIVAQTKADLHRTNVLSDLAEQFGMALNHESYLRYADNDLKLSEVSNEVHEISKVFTGAIYDILADAFTFRRNSRNSDDAIVLYQVGQEIFRLVVKALRNAPDQEATYADVARSMLEVAQAEHPDYVHFIEKQFTVREVIGPHQVSGPTEFADFRNCCGTLQSLEWHP